MKLKLAVLIAALIIVIVFFGGVKTALAQTCSGSSTYPYTSYNCTFTGSTYTCVSNSNSGTASCGYLSGVCSACRNCGQACTGGASGCNITNNCPGGSGCGTGYSQDTTGCFVSGGATATPGGPTPTTGPAPTSPPVGCNDNSKPTQFIGYIVLDQNINGAVDDSCSAPVNVGHNIGFTNNCVGGYNFSQNDVVCGGFNRTITGRIGVNGNTWATWNGTCNPPGGWLCGPSRSRSGDFSFWDYNTVPTPLTFWSRPDVTCSVFGPASLLTGQSGTFTTTCSGSALGSGNSYIVIHNSGGSTISSTAGGASSASVTFPFPAAGTYYARAGFVNNANAANCSGNPFYSPNRGGYPQLPGGVIDCRSSGDWITVTVSNSPTNTPVPTLPPPPTFPPPTPGCVPPAPPTSLSPNGNTNCAPPGLPIPVTFSWSPSGASNYILRIDDKSDGWIGANDTYIDTLGTNSYTRNVVAGRTYDWWVYVGPMSCYSAATAATAIVPVCPTPPAPTGAPTNFQASALCSPPRGYLSWNSVAGASNYRVERCQGSTCSAFTQIGTTTGTNYSDSTVSDLTTYRYRVRGYFLSTGTFTPYTNTLTVTLACVPPATPTTSPSQCILPAPVDPGPAICGEATWSWAAIQCGGVVATEYEIDIYNSTTGAIVIDNGWRPASDFGCSGGGLCKYITPLPAGTYYSRVRAGNSAGGFTPSNWSVPFTQSVDSCSLPTCNATLLVSVYSMTPGETQTTLASISSLSPPDAVINEVHFSSNNPAVIAYPAAPADADSTFSYTNTATALAPGTADLTATVHATSTGYNHVTACIDTQTVSVVEPDPWWQVRDADVLSEGDLTDPISSTATNPYFNLAGAGGYPGIPILNGTASFGNGSVSQIPPFGWIVNSATSFSGTSANPIYGYNFLKNLAPTEVRNCTGSSNGCIPAGDTIPAGNLLLAGFNSGGYTWRRALGDLRIHGTGNINNNKMVVLVEGNLYLGYNNLTPTNTRINLNDGQGFVAFIVKGNIIISEEVASAGDSVGVGDINGSPGLEGIYMADGTISTGHFSAGADYQLRIRGMLIGWGGITFQRDLGGSGNGTQPSEYIQYAPDLQFTYPARLGVLKLRWNEVAP